MDFNALYLIITIVLIAVFILAFVDTTSDEPAVERELEELDWDKIQTTEDVTVVLRAVIAPTITFDPSDKRGKTLWRYRKICKQ